MGAADHRGLVAICPIVELEMLRTARSEADREELVALLRSAFGWVAMPERAFDRGLQVQAAPGPSGAPPTRRSGT